MAASRNSKTGDDPQHEQHFFHFGAVNLHKQLFGIFDFVFKQHILSLFLSVVDCSYQRIDGSTDDIRVYACTPGKCSVRLLDADIGDRTGFGTLL